MPSLTIETLTEQPVVALTTFKRDGTPVSTPVHVVVRDGRAYFRTYDKAWKVKRLRNDPRVTVAPSTFKGEPTGDAVPGRARQITAAEARPLKRMLARKHPFMQGVLVPIFHRAKRYTTLYYELTLDED
ncbi:PPOX class F420-dependent oxidoreductase [Spirillospora sp. CA-294931]|uniref:PPOX class F420-dependent oxidoreductase n=1 Tax=Spirillospora sp. CA-294931 TaxID=3240042 RepID=UPI003D91A2F4